MGINIVVLFRDNERYVQNFFQSVIQSGFGLEIPTYLVFVENGSKDRTRTLLVRALEDRPGVLVTLGNTKELDAMPRPLRISKIRNGAKQFVKTSYEYTILIDSDIYFDPGRVSDFLKRFCEFGDHAAMLCAYGLEAYPQPNGTFSTIGHYYDTFAFVDIVGRGYWPDCIFSTCNRCRGPMHELGPDGLLQVRSAFGGMAILRTVDYLSPDVLYTSEINEKGIWVCEHIGFCESLSKATGKNIFVDSHSAVYWDRSSFNA